MEFAAENLSGKLVYELRKLLWDVEVGNYLTMQEGLLAYGAKWKENRPFLEAIDLIIGSLSHGETRRQEMLDQSVDVILAGNREGAKHFTQELNTPVMFIHAMGIILPLLGFVMFPLLAIFLNIGSAVLFVIYDVMLPAIRVMVEKPLEACVASQIAGWQLEPPGTPDAQIAAGPVRALNRLNADHYLQWIDYRDQHDEGVVAIQTAAPVRAETAETIARACNLRPENLYILVAPNSSLVCAIQVSARIVEQTLHRVAEEGFDINAVKYAQGWCVIPPVIKDEIVAMGRINDALLYGGAATLYVEASDEAVEKMVRRVTSSASRAYGRPFLEIFEDAGRDFYQIPLDLHSPALVHVNNLTTGRTFSAGEINYRVLRRSFFGKE